MEGIRRIDVLLAALVSTLAFTPAALAVEDYANPQIEPLYQAEPVYPDRIVVQYDRVPANKTWIRVRHMGDVGTPELLEQVSHPVQSDRSLKTGLVLPSPFLIPRGRFQRGFKDDPEGGTNVYQAFGRQFGWHINTFQFSHEQPIECPPAFPACSGGPNITYARRFEPGLDPWRTPSSEFTLQVYLKLPKVHYVVEDQIPAGQVSFLYYLEHQPTGYLIAGIVNLFDSRPFSATGRERVSDDGITAFVSSDLRNRQPDGSPYRYVTRSPYSQPSRNRYGWKEERFFRAHVSHENLEAILEDANAPGIPGEYRVISSSILIEVFPRITGNISMAGSLRNFELYRFHDGD